MLASTPWLGIIVGTICSMAFGAFWYKVCSNAWMDAAGLTEEDVEGGPGAPTMILTVICQLVMCFVLAGVMYHAGEQTYSVRAGLISALLVWVGFVVTTQTVNNMFQGKPRALTMIDCGNWLGVLVIQSIAIGLLG